MLQKVVVVAYALMIGASAQDCPCYTATLPDQVSYCPASTCGPVPACLAVVTSIVPGTNSNCPVTPTIVFSRPCETACPTGCGATSTSFTTLSEACPTTTSSLPSVTPSTCFTYTSIPPAQYCPELTTCINLACVQLVTETLPPVDVACPSTTVLVATPSCLRTCTTGCATVITTVQASVSLTRPMYPGITSASTSVKPNASSSNSSVSGIQQPSASSAPAIQTSTSGGQQGRSNPIAWLAL